jgi:hypothetical protein
MGGQRRHILLKMADGAAQRITDDPQEIVTAATFVVI